MTNVPGFPFSLLHVPVSQTLANGQTPLSSGGSFPHVLFPDACRSSTSILLRCKLPIDSRNASSLVLMKPPKSPEIREALKNIGLCLFRTLSFVNNHFASVSFCRLRRPISSEANWLARSCEWVNASLFQVMLNLRKNGSNRRVEDRLRRPNCFVVVSLDSLQIWV